VAAVREYARINIQVSVAVLVHLNKIDDDGLY